jgi:hypothetical protein
MAHHGALRKMLGQLRHIGETRAKAAGEFGRERWVQFVPIGSNASG